MKVIQNNLNNLDKKLQKSDKKLEKIEKEEEEIISSNRKLTGSMVGRRRILTTWAVGEAWEVFYRERAMVVRQSFRVLGIARSIDESCDHVMVQVQEEEYRVTWVLADD